MSVTQTDPLIGALLGGRYEVVTRINRGGTAVVYRGNDKRLGRTVAIKVIHSDLAADPEYVDRFDREAKAAAMLSHPNIVAVFDRGWAGERPYIVMEYIRGQSLRSIISSSAPLPPALALSYGHEVAKALAAAHEAGLIHRDVKPENVLITSDGQVKVTDFGLAKTVANPTTTASKGRVMGTMSYVAPEIPQAGTAFLASDIYSTGVVLFEMLTGKKPHVGPDVSYVLMKHINEDIGPPSHALAGQARSRIPDYLDALVVACTSRDSERRPADGRVLEEMIAKARRSLEAGLLHDDELVRQFSSGRSEPEPTPVLPIGASTVPRTSAAAKSGTPTTSPATKLAKAAPTKTRASAQRTGSTRRAGLIIGGVCAVIVLALIAVLLNWAFVWRWTTVPALIDDTEQTARNEVATASLRINVIPEYSETVPLGQIIRTDPQAESRVRKDTLVTAWVSRGPERYLMPTVVGLPLDEARTAIAYHLAIGTVTEDWSETVPTGQVISASQEPGVSLPPNTSVDLVVSKGRQPIDIVNQVGQTEEAATLALQGAGFQVDATGRANSPSVPKGSVVSQEPAEGQGHLGDIIKLVISDGPRMIEVPSVTAMQLVDAKTKLQNTGFVVDVQNGNMIGVPMNIAYATDPPAGQLAAEGSTVILYIV